MGNPSPENTASDLELFQRTSSGDEDAFVEIVDRYKDHLYNFLRRLVSDGVEAEDLLQKTFFKVYKKSLDHSTVRNFSSWIFTIAANLARDELRRRARVDKNTYSLEEHHIEWARDRRGTPSDRAAQSELRDRIERAVASLDDIYRMVFVLRDIEGMSYEEIAGILNIRVGTVKSRLNRARLRLQERLGPYVKEVTGYEV